MYTLQRVYKLLESVALRWHNAVAGPLLEWGKNLVRDTQIRQKIVRSGAQQNRFW